MLAKFDMSFEGGLPYPPAPAPEHADLAHSGGSPIPITTVLLSKEGVLPTGELEFLEVTEQDFDGTIPRSEVEGPSYPGTGSADRAKSFDGFRTNPPFGGDHTGTGSSFSISIDVH